MTVETNAFAERWVRSVREECLDQILIINENHLRRVLKEYGEYYNHARPHQGIGQGFPVSVPRQEQRTKGPIRRRDILGGVIHDYHRQPSSRVSGDGLDFYTIQAAEKLDELVTLVEVGKDPANVSFRDNY